jgi:hypothetical protein
MQHKYTFYTNTAYTHTHTNRSEIETSFGRRHDGRYRGRSLQVVRQSNGHNVCGRLRLGPPALGHPIGECRRDSHRRSRRRTAGGPGRPSGGAGASARGSGGSSAAAQARISRGGARGSGPAVRGRRMAAQRRREWWQEAIEHAGT